MLLACSVHACLALFTFLTGDIDLSYAIAICDPCDELHKVMSSRRQQHVAGRPGCSWLQSGSKRCGRTTGGINLLGRCALVIQSHVSDSSGILSSSCRISGHSQALGWIIDWIIMLTLNIPQALSVAICRLITPKKFIQPCTRIRSELRYPLSPICSTYHNNHLSSTIKRIYVSTQAGANPSALCTRTPTASSIQRRINFSSMYTRRTTSSLQTNSRTPSCGCYRCRDSYDALCTDQ